MGTNPRRRLGGSNALFQRGVLTVRGGVRVACALLAAAACTDVIGLTQVPPVAITASDDGSVAGQLDSGSADRTMSPPSEAGMDGTVQDVTDRDVADQDVLNQDDAARDAGSADAGRDGSPYCDHRKAVTGEAIALACGQHAPSSIQVAGGIVYFTEYEGGNVWRVPSTGGAPIALATAQDYPWAIVVDDRNAYWLNYANADALGTTVTPAGAVMQVPLDGGTPLPLATGLNGPYGIAVDAANVYFTTADGYVMSVPIGGGAPTTLAANQDLPAGIAVDQSHVYWANNTGASILRADKQDGGSLQPIAKNEPGVLSVAVDSANVYFTTYATTGKVLSVPLAGGAVATLAAAQSWPLGITVDDSSVYWTNSGTGAGAVSSVGIDGGAGKLLAGTANWTLFQPAGIAVDSASLYFVTLLGDTVWRLDPK
jgi:hypothetical protein